MARIAYISFDRVPAPKGASTHIEAFARGLAAEFGALDLVTVSATPNPAGPFERWPGVLHWELPALGPSLVDRAVRQRANRIRHTPSQHPQTRASQLTQPGERRPGNRTGQRGSPRPEQEKS